jgi:hypothetical protein
MVDEVVQPDPNKPMASLPPAASFAAISFFASSEKSVGEGERQRCLSMRNLRNFLQVESNDLC